MTTMDLDAPVVILGATGGMGERLARRLTATGRSLFLIGRDPGKVAALAADLGAGFAVADAADAATIGKAIAEVPPERGISGLAYCIGSIVLKPLKALTEVGFLETFRLNTLGAALAVQAAEKGLRQAKGSVVLFSTVAAAQGFPNHAAIAAAKAGVEGLARSLAAELAPAVRVNAIAPSLTRTAMAAPFTGNPQMAQGIAQLHPLGRLGEPDDAAALAAFLMGPDSGWITGQVIGVDGGRGSLRIKG